MGVLQTTVAEIVTVKEHQRECILESAGSGPSNFRQLEPTLSCPLFGVLGMSFSRFAAYNH